MSADDSLRDLVLFINKYEKPAAAHLEIETRYTIDPRGSRAHKSYTEYDAQHIAKHFIKSCIENEIRCEIDQSINFIKNDNQIKQLCFISGIQQKDKQQHYQKTKVVQPVIVLGTRESPGFKFTVNLEEKIAPFEVTEAKFARIRLRFSAFLERWRVDVSLVKTITNLSNPQELKAAKTAILTNVKVDSFCDSAPWSIIDQIEFEAEFTADHKDFNTDDLVFVNGLLDDQVSSLSSQSSQADQTDHTQDQPDHKVNDYQLKLYQVARDLQRADASKFKHTAGLKQLGNQAIDINKNSFFQIAPKITDYYITDKVDGERTIIYIKNGAVYALSGGLVTLPVTTGDTGTFVLDTEYYEPLKRYFIFDVMYWRNKPVVNTPFEQRLKLFSDAVDLAPGILAEKPFTRLTSDYRQQIRDLKQASKKYETDGFVLTPAPETYFKMTVYKYKPIERSSADFLIKACPRGLLGVQPYNVLKGSTLYLLFCGVSKKVFQKLKLTNLKQNRELFPTIDFHNAQYFPVPFEPSDQAFAYLYYDERTDLDGLVGEFCYRDQAWSMLKIREDRATDLQRGNYFGNNYRTVETLWLNYQFPLVIEDLTDDDLHSHYFQESDSAEHRASRHFNSFVKTEIIKRSRGADYVLDLASGKGQDFFRYAAADIGTILFVERDPVALMELINRKHEFASGTAPGKMRVMTQCLDLNADFSENIERLNTNLQMPATGFNAVFCNLAFHYLIGTPAHLTNITKFISSMTAPGGRFTFTAFDGAAVVNLIGTNTEYKSASGKFHIVKKYTGSKLTTEPQKISVRLPFSRGEYYDEFLINETVITAKMKAAGLTLEIKQSFGEFIESYSGAGELDAEDREYCSLYHCYTYFKTVKGSSVKRGSRK